MEDFIRNAAATFHHRTCTAKMGRDSMPVVGANFRSMESKISDGSIMPRVTTGNAMAPCLIIGERAGEFLRGDHTI